MSHPLHTTPSSPTARPLPRWATLLVASAAVLGFTACAGMSDRTRDTAIGAAVGGVAGSVITGSPAGAVGGAVVGGVIGNQNDKKK